MENDINKDFSPFIVNGLIGFNYPPFSKTIVLTKNDSIVMNSALLRGYFTVDEILYLKRNYLLNKKNTEI